MKEKQRNNQALIESAEQEYRERCALVEKVPEEEARMQERLAALQKRKDDLKAGRHSCRACAARRRMLP